MVASSPVNVDRLALELANHPDKSFVTALVDGFRAGFNTGIIASPEKTFECKNLLSAKNNPEFVSQQLTKEVQLGYMLGGYTDPPFPDDYRVSPIGVAQHKFSGKKRLILDLSSPHNRQEITSINDLIPREHFRLSYVKVDDAITIIKQLGKGAWLTKLDIQDAFKIVPIMPSQWKHYCVKWQGLYYVFIRLPFGSRSSPFIFTQLSEAVAWIAKHNYGIPYLLFLLDDFLAVDKDFETASQTKATLLKLFHDLGIPLNEKKTEGPVTSLTYLGVGLDTLEFKAFLPRDKLDRISSLLDFFMDRKKCTKRQLLSLLGSLNFCARVVIPGRTFLCNLIERSKKVRQLHHFIDLTSECKEDIFMWICLLKNWNGVSFFFDSEFCSTRDLTLYTDASSSFGFGAYLQSRQEFLFDSWINHPVPVSEHSLSYMELYPIVASALVWGQFWKGKRIVFLVDNQGLSVILAKGRAKSPAINQLLRRLVLVATTNHFTFTSSWLATSANVLADALSRNNLSLFQEMAPAATQVICPPSTEIQLTYKQQFASTGTMP